MAWKKVEKSFKIKNYTYPNKKARWLDRDTGLRKNYDGSLEKPTFMKSKNGRLPKTKRKVQAKVMYEAGWGSKNLSKLFGVTQDTIVNWSKVPTSESLKDFEAKFKAAMLDVDMEATFKVKSRILELVPEEKNIEKLVKAGQFFSGEKERRNQNNTQVNVYADMLKKHSQEPVIVEEIKQ